MVDDNEVDRRSLEEILINWRMIPVMAGSVLTALTHLEQAREVGRPFSLVMIDAMMPGIEGFHLAERLKADPDLVENVLLIQNSEGWPRGGPRITGGQITIRGGSTTACLTKPINPFELKAAIFRSLDQKSRAGQSPRPSDTSNPPPATQPLRILMAEDNPFNQRVVLLMLKKFGHSVTIVVNGLEAIAALESQSFDVVLMDLQMPEMDGFQATLAIRLAEAGTSRHIPIIALTAHAMKEDRDRCLNAGMDDYISKPIELARLRQAIEGCLFRPQRPAETSPIDAEAGSPMDLAAALALLDGDRAFLGEMAAKFLDKAPQLLEEAQTGIKLADSERTGKAVHELKNWIANFVAPAAIEAATALEGAAKAGELAAASRLLASLRSQLHRLMPVLDRLVSHPEGAENHEYPTKNWSEKSEACTL